MFQVVIDLERWSIVQMNANRKHLYNCRQKSSVCSKKKYETLISIANKKQPEPPRVKSRASRLTTKDVKDSHDVVVGTLVHNDILARILFDSNATYSFVPHETGTNLNVPGEPLDDVYVT